MSYGLDDQGRWCHFCDPTPGEPNGLGLHVLPDPDLPLSVRVRPGRGVYTAAPVVTTLETVQCGQAAEGEQDTAVILLYTTDGSDPTAGAGLPYDGQALAFSHTTVLRVAALGRSGLLAPAETHTIIVAADVLAQTRNQCPRSLPEHGLMAPRASRTLKAWEHFMQ